MKIVHRLDETQVIKKEGEGYFLLTDRAGGFLSLGSPMNVSHTQGWFHLDKDWNMYKCVENFILDKHLTGIENDFSSVSRVYDESKETFHLTPTALIYEVNNYNGPITLSLDFRKMFDFDDQNRTYNFYEKDGLIIFHYKKDNKFLAINTNSSYEEVHEWKKRLYVFDKHRNSKYDFYTYNPIRFWCEDDTKMFLGFADTENEAISKVLTAMKNESILKESLEIHKKKICKSKKLTANIALNSLDSLKVHIDNHHVKDGIFAGLPWFGQFWSRDELISIKAFILNGDYDFVKKKLMYYLHLINDEGRIPNRIPHSDLSSADSIFWLFKRIHDLLQILDDKKILNKYFSNEELNFIKHKLHLSLEEQLVRKMENHLIKNELKETWMDTTAQGFDGRKGFSLEIQTLLLASFKLMRTLCRMLKMSYFEYKSLEELLVKNVRQAFFKNDLLFDTINDSTARPNVFIAYYTYPELLSNFEWKMIFDKILSKIWLDWGGLSSVGKDSPLFKANHTGETNESYHNGDSWFWINCLAGICMFELDKKKYDYFIERIYKATEQELLFSGFVGHLSEISSASKRESQGCMAQAWSTAMFIELAYKGKLI